VAAANQELHRAICERVDAGMERLAAMAVGRGG
jgi:hypothetical protein